MNKKKKKKKKKKNLIFIFINHLFSNIKRWMFNQHIHFLQYTNLIPSDSLLTLVEAMSAALPDEVWGLKNVQTERTQLLPPIVEDIEYVIWQVSTEVATVDPTAESNNKDKYVNGTGSATFHTSGNICPQLLCGTLQCEN